MATLKNSLGTSANPKDPTILRVNREQIRIITMDQTAGLKQIGARPAMFDIDLQDMQGVQ